MPLFTLKDVKSLCGATSYKRGEDYYRTGKVTRLKRSADGTGYTATVKGSKSYRVEIDYIDDGEIEAFCECPAYYSYEHDCKHIAAVLIAIYHLDDDQPVMGWGAQIRSMEDFSAGRDPMQANKYDMSRPLTGRSPMLTVAEKEAIKYRHAEQLIDEYRRHSLSHAEFHTDSGLVRESLNFEYTLRIEGHHMPRITIEMRAGVKRLYVVQKMESFLESIAMGKVYMFTSLFSYDPLKHEIGGKDQAVLDLLIQMKRTADAYREYYAGLSQYGSGVNQRALFIEPRVWSELLPHLASVDARLEDGGGSKPALELRQDKPSLKFQLTDQGNNKYQLQVGKVSDARLLPAYNCVVIGGSLHPMEPQEMQKLSELRRLVVSSDHKGKLDISGAQLNNFVQHVIPALRELGQVKLDTQIRERIQEAELLIQLYMDYADGYLTARPVFQYGDVQLHPLEQREPASVDEESRILIRDTVREQGFLNFMNDSVMHRDGHVWKCEIEEDMYDVLYHLLPQLEEQVEIYWSQSLKSIVRDRKQQPKVHADLAGDMNWLEISFDMDDVEEHELLHIMQSIVEKKKYYRLRDGSFLSLEEEGYRGFSDIVDRLGLGVTDFRGGVAQLPAVRALRIADYKDASKSTRFGRALRQFLNQFNDLEQLDYELPTGIQAQLRDYQVLGFQWLKMLSSYRFGGILADDMGLGKTLQSIAYILSEQQQAQEKKLPIMVVAPSSLIYNWAHELARFTPQLRVLLIAGQKEERSAIWSNMSEADVVVTSYPLLRRDSEAYSDQLFHALFLDEAQAIKNAASQTAQAVAEIKAAHRFALTGTPIENSLDELWSIFNVVFPGLFPNRKSFRDLPAQQIARIVRPFILRRLKQEVLSELPEKIETVQYPELVTEQKKLYAAYLTNLQQETEHDLKSAGFQKSRMKILAGITRLRQLCCHPGLFIEGYKGTSGKMQHLLELVEEFTASGRRLLIFSQYASMLQILERELESTGRTLFYLDGQTPSHERVELCQRYNAGEGELFLISLKAGGTGLNLTGADTVILYDLWWNPAVEEQAVGRAHRMGQKQVVQVIRLVAEGTIEEKIMELQQRKRDLIGEVIDAENTSAAALTERDILELLGV